MDWTQTLTIVGTGLTIIGTLGALIIGLHKVTNQRIDDLADSIKAIREDIRLIVNKLIPDKKIKK